MENPFTLSFGNKPFEYISRNMEKDQLIVEINLTNPVSHCFIISGVRGSGKTVLLSSIYKEMEKDKDWITIELNSGKNIEEGLAAKLYTHARVKHLFVEKNFNFSFQGFSFSIKGENPILNVEDLLERMFAILKKQNKKVLVLIDEASPSKEMKEFALTFQMLIRKEYGLFLIMTSLYENISALENTKNLTFLIRAPKIYLSPLNISSIASSFESTLKVNHAKALEFAYFTKGYAFAFQLLGYLLFKKEEKEIDASLLSDFDSYLKEYVYLNVYDDLTNVEKTILNSLDKNDNNEIKDILEKTNLKKEYFSKYRDRLIKKGILYSPCYGILSFSLPRMKEFLEGLYN